MYLSCPLLGIFQGTQVVQSDLVLGLCLSNGVLVFIPSCHCEVLASGQLVGYLQHLGRLLQCFPDVFFKFSEFIDLVRAEFIEGVEELVHLSIFLVQYLIFLLIFFFSLLVLEICLQISEFLLVDVDVFFCFFCTTYDESYRFSMLLIELLSSFILASILSLASGMLKLASLSCIS
jgi:hypothetical protein